VFPGAIFTPTFSMIMNRKTWASLSPADQKAIMSVSGEAFAHRMTEMDAWEKAAYAKFRASGRTIVEAKGDFAAAVRKAWTPMQDAWVAQAKELGVDGKAALDFYREQAKAVAGGAK
jgi:TRAP-type C4-dicarboxylate transport system substrate-binding protein